MNRGRQVIDVVRLDANAARPAYPAACAAYEQVEAALASTPGAQRRARAARETLELARADVARQVGAAPEEIIFVSGGTEAAAWAVAGAMHARPAGRLVTTALEHPAVGRTAAMVAEHPAYVWECLPCSRSGRMQLAALQKACRKAPTRLVSMIAASNETGVLQPVAELAAWCRQHNILCHTDAVQAMGRQAVSLHDWQVDLASWAGHKLGAPGAIGCLYVRRGVPLQPPWLPWNSRPEQVVNLEDPEISPAAAAAMAAALQQRSADEERRIEARRDAFEAALRARIPNVEVIGAQAPRLGHTSCIRFIGCAADGLMMALDMDGFCCSTGSACASGSIEPSPVLLGMGYSAEQAREALRFSLDASVTEAHLQSLVTRLVTLVLAMRQA